MFKNLFYQIHLIVFGIHTLDWNAILQLPKRSRQKTFSELHFYQHMT
jgi:hypothetical protein